MEKKCCHFVVEHDYNSMPSQFNDDGTVIVKYFHSIVCKLCEEVIFSASICEKDYNETGGVENARKSSINKNE